MTSTVLGEQTNGVRTVTLNRPERLNAISVELVEDLYSALSEALADESSDEILLRRNDGGVEPPDEIFVNGFEGS